MSGSDSDHTDEAMSGKGKKSDDSKRKSKERPSSAEAMSGPDSNHTDEDMPGKGKKSDKEQPGPSRAMSGPDSNHTDETPRRTKTPTVKKETADHSLKLENKGDKVKSSTKRTPNKKGNAEGDGQDKEDEPGSDSTPQKSGQLTKKLESDQGAVRGSDQDIKTPRRTKTTTVTWELTSESTKEVTEEKTIDHPQKPDSEDEITPRRTKTTTVTRELTREVTKEVTEEKTIDHPQKPDSEDEIEKTPRKNLKSNKFVSESLGMKEITEVPGIDKEHSKKLIENGYLLARDLMKKFLSEDEKEFIDFLPEKGSVDKRWRKEIFKACEKWTYNHPKEAEELKTEAEEEKTKFNKFVSELLEGKDISEVPGIKEEHAKKLSNDYPLAEDLVKKFLSEDINMDKKEFIDFLAREGIDHKGWQYEIYNACKTWTDNHPKEAEELKTEAEEEKTKAGTQVNES